MSGGTPVAQVRNTELVDILSADFVKNYAATTAWGNAVSNYLMLPGLRGFWPMSSVDESGNTHDLSGQGRTLTKNGNPAFTYNSLAPQINLDGTGDYLSRADEAGLDIVGNESYFSTAARGLTMGGWFYADSLANFSLMSKWTDDLSNNRAYLLRLLSTGVVRSYVSTDGTASVTCDSTNAIAATSWFFAVERFDPSAELAVFLNGIKSTNLVGVPATLYNSAAEFEIGARNAGATEDLDGRASLCFLTATALPDAIIQSLYHHSRALFGV